jgi:hypothetical protein
MTEAEQQEHLALTLAIVHFIDSITPNGIDAMTEIGKIAGIINEQLTAENGPTSPEATTEGTEKGSQANGVTPSTNS